MPAPAVIPAPIAYINAAAVKGFVVECGVLGSFGRFVVLSFPTLLQTRPEPCGSSPSLAVVKLFAEEANITHATHVWPRVVITVKKTACSRQPLAAE